MPVYSHNVTQPLSINQVFCSNGMVFCGPLYTNSACANVVSASNALLFHKALLQSGTISAGVSLIPNPKYISCVSVYPDHGFFGYLNLFYS